MPRDKKKKGTEPEKGPETGNGATHDPESPDNISTQDIKVPKVDGDGGVDGFDYSDAVAEPVEVQEEDRAYEVSVDEQNLELGEIAEPVIEPIFDAIFDPDFEPIVDPRLATVEPSLPQPEAPSGPSVVELQERVSQLEDLNVILQGDLQVAQTQLSRRKEEISVLNAEVQQRQEKADVDAKILLASQSRLLEQTMHAANLAEELNAAQAQVVALQAEFESQKTRSIFQVIPTYREGQATVTRIYVLANDVGDVIRRLEASGILQASEIANISRTSEKLVIA